MTAKSKTEPAAPPRAVRNVKTVPIDAIHIDPGNVRVHPERNKATIRASLARFGAGRSIVLDGHNVVRAGNGTVEQAREAGYTEVLVVEPGPNQIVAVKRADWSDSVGTAYSIADNTSTDQSEDDQSKLAATLEALRNDGFDLAAMGHTSEGLDELLKTLADEALADGAPANSPPPEDPGPQIDRADELQKKWGTASGQLWLIPSKTASGEHRLLCGDSTKPDDVTRACGGQVQMCVTSPPYWGLRSYGIGTENGELGLEATPAEFVAAMTGVFAEVKRVLRDDGAAFVNLGDSYAGGGKGNYGTGISTHNGTVAKHCNGADFPTPPGLKPKDLVGIPWRVAFALQADGWYLRADIIWHKPNPMPESVTDRPTKSHEYIFLMAKQERYYWDQEAVREDLAPISLSQIALASKGVYDAGGTPKGTGRLHPGDKACLASGASARGASMNPAGRNTRSVWTITPQPFKEAHFATFPVELAARCISAGSSQRGACPTCGAPWERVTETTPEYEALKESRRGTKGYESRGLEAGNRFGSETGGLSRPSTTLGWRPTCSHSDEPQPCAVFDPFLGAATTIVACEQHGRLGRGIELSPQYVAIALERLAGMGLEPRLS